MSYHEEERVLNTLQTWSEILGVLRASEALVFVIESEDFGLSSMFLVYWYLCDCEFVSGPRSTNIEYTLFMGIYVNEQWNDKIWKSEFLLSNLVRVPRGCPQRIRFIIDVMLLNNTRQKDSAEY